MSKLSNYDIASSEKKYNHILRCAAKTCYNSTSERPFLKFFRFPTNATYARIWATNSGREDLLSKSLFAMRRYVLCAEHFEDKYFETGYEKKTVFIDNSKPVPTIFENNLNIYTWRETKLYTMDDIKQEFDTDDVTTNINITDNDVSASTEFGRLKYTDDLYEEFILNPGVLSVKTDVSDKLIKREYCRLCAKKLPILNLIAIFDSSGCTSYGDMLETCLPGMFNKNDKYPHEICASCVTKLENCYNILKSFIEADNNIRKIFSNKETATLISEKLNKADPIDDVEDILNSFEDKSLVVINSEFENEPNLQIVKKEIETEDELLLKLDNLNENKSSLNYENETVKNEPEIKFQCLQCLIVFNNKYDVMNHSYLTHSVNESDIAYRVVRVKLKGSETKKEENDENKDIKSAINITSSANKSKETFIMKFRCVKCSKLFKTKKHVLDHSLTEHPDENKVIYKPVKVKKKLLNNKNPAERYECLLCNSQHTGRDTLLKHTRLHHPNLAKGKFLCRILKPKKFRNHNVTCLRCTETFESVTKYRTHIKKHVSYKCEKCGMSFDKIFKLRNHRKTHNDPKTYSCVGCDKTFSSKGMLNAHEEIHKQLKASVSCSKCDKQFTSEFTLQKHQRVHESALCNFCGKLFPAKIYLLSHLKIHSEERPYKCNVCNKSFKTTGVLGKHKESHEPEKKYICQVCGKLFRTLSTFNQHMKLHTDKKYFCEICNIGYHRRSYLIKHKLTHNKEEHKVLTRHQMEKKSYSCSVCSKNFSANSQMKVHFRLHSGERPYQCDFCEKSFRSKASLNQHRLIHLDVFPHECNFCNRKFRRLQSLIVHRKTHTGERPFPCPTCGRAFANRQDMVKHKKIHDRASGTNNELNFNDDVTNADYMNYVDVDDAGSHILQSILIRNST